ncbi:MAG: phenylalanine--tRNA ligase subunit beta [Acidilobaceae archaeon]
MPVLRFRPERLYELTGIDLELLREYLFKLKCEVEESEGYIAVEVNADRPDMFIGEGLARAVKGIQGLEEGWVKPRTIDSGLSLRVEDVPSRPYIVAAIVYDVNIDSEAYLEELIQFQEKLHEGLGRSRRRAAVGLHDLDKIPSKNLSYRMVSVDDEFIPLGYSKPMKIRDVLERDEKGLAYGKISRLGDRHPAIISGDEIITIPPVLNSNITRLDVGTRNLFIDVTSTSLETAEAILNIIVSNLAERSRAIVGLVRINSPWGGYYPRLEPRAMSIKANDVNSILGTSYSLEDIATMLRRMRYNVYIRGDYAIIEIPPYRIDVSKPIDIAEDVAIYVGYESIGFEKPVMLYAKRGEYSRLSRLVKIIRTILVGMNFTEVMQLSLVSPTIVDALGFRDYSVEVLNPVQVDYSILRPTLAATILKVLRENTHMSKPLKIFEIGPVVYRSNGGIIDEECLAIALMDEDASYEQLQAVVYTLLRTLGVTFTVRKAIRPHTMDGRTSEILVGGVAVGYIGEVKPEVLEAIGLDYPVVLAEISLNKMVEKAD